MGRRSVKTDKSPLQLSREALGLSREKASERAVYLSEDRIEKIESGRSQPRPDEVIALSTAYRDPYLCPEYCRRECAIGARYMPPVPREDVARVVLETLDALNTLERRKDRLIEVAADGKLTPDEYADFAELAEQMKRLSGCALSLQLWAESAMKDKGGAEL